MSATSREGSKWEDVMFRRTVETVGDGLRGVDVGGGIWYVVLFCDIFGREWVGSTFLRGTVLLTSNFPVLL